MQERNVVGGLMAALMSGFMDFMEPLKWFMLLGGILIVVDLRFGVLAARRRGETIRTSRAVRRTLNKVIDYLCWILVAGAMGKAFGMPFEVPVLPAIILLVIYGCEVNSCFSNYFESHGKRFRVNVFRWFGKKADIIEVEDKEKGGEV